MKNIRFVLLAVATVTLGLTSVRADSSVPKTYPFTKCVVSGDKLGGHEKPIKVSYKGTDVWLCCSDCKSDFNKNPAKYVKMVKDQEAKQMPKMK